MLKFNNLPISVPDCRLPVNLRSNSATVPFFFFIGFNENWLVSPLGTGDVSESVLADLEAPSFFCVVLDECTPFSVLAVVAEEFSVFVERVSAFYRLFSCFDCADS